MSVFDLRRGRIVKDIGMDSCATIVCRNSRQICVGHSDGSVTLRDPRTFRVEGTLKPHQLHVMAMDVKSDLLVSCGYMQRGPRTTLEHMLKVYDVRMMRMLQTIRFDEGAFFVKFHPSLTSSVAAASPSGNNVQLLDVSQTGGQVSHQWFINSPSQEIFCADFCSTGECLAFGDADGYVHLWSAVSQDSHSRPFNVNLYSHRNLYSFNTRQPPKPSQTLGESLLSLPWITPLLQATAASPNLFQAIDEVPPTENSQTPLLRTPEKPRHTGGSSSAGANAHASSLPSSAEPIRSSTPPPRATALTPKTPTSASSAPFSLTLPRSRNSVSAGDWNGFARREQPLNALDEHLFRPLQVPQPIDPDVLKFMRVTAGIGVIATEPGTRKRNLARDDPSLLQEVRSDLSEQFEEAYEDTLPPGTPLRTGPGATGHSKAPRPFRLIPAHHPSGRFGHFDYSQYNRTDHVGLEHLGPPSQRCNPVIQLLYAIPQLRMAVRNHLCSSEFCTLCELGFLFHMMHVLAEQPEEESSRTGSPKNLIRCVRALPKAAISGLFDEEFDSLSSLVEKFNRFLLTQMHDEALHNKLLNGCTDNSSVVERILGSVSMSHRKCTSCGTTTSQQHTSFAFKLRSPMEQADLSEMHTKATSFSSMFAATLIQQSQAHIFCEKCETFQITSVTQETESLPPQLNVVCDLSGESSEESFWSSVSDDYTPARGISADHWLPFYLRIYRGPSAPDDPSSVERNQWIVQEFDKLPPQLADDADVYEISAVVSSIKDDDLQHMVAQIRTNDDQWHLFNDFHVAECGRLDAVHISSDWKTPCIIHYTRRNALAAFPVGSFTNPITVAQFFDSPTPCDNPINSLDQLASLEREIAIDAEFVLMQEEQSEDTHGGMKRQISPNEFGVARISLIGTEKESQAERYLMDDYITTNSSDIVNYLTQFSGIQPGDLDRKTSKHHLVSLKTAYLKLRYLVDSGYTFVGHGLSKDFSTINIVVPSKQVVDTVTLFHLENQRMISLRFLASVLLGIDIQQQTHDSIEDSRAALHLYRMYRKLQHDGTFEDALYEIYAIGRKRGWKTHEGDRIQLHGDSTPDSHHHHKSHQHDHSSHPAPTTATAPDTSNDNPPMHT